MPSRPVAAAIAVTTAVGIRIYSTMASMATTDSTQTSPLPRITPAAFAFAAGIGLAGISGATDPGPALMLALLGTAILAFVGPGGWQVGRRTAQVAPRAVSVGLRTAQMAPRAVPVGLRTAQVAPRAVPVGLRAAPVALFLTVLTSLGAARLIVAEHRLPRDALSSLVAGDGTPSADPPLLTIRGRAAGPVRRLAAEPGPLANWDHRTPRNLIPVHVETLRMAGGEWRDCTARLSVITGEPVAPIRSGATITATGYLESARRRANPGTRARSHGASGDVRAIIVPNRSLLRVEDTRRRGWLSWRHDMRGWARDILAAGHDEASGPRTALCRALLLGQRDEQTAPLERTFRRVGLAHLLALSGLHLGLLLGLIDRAAGVALVNRRLRGVLIGVTTLAFLSLVEVRLPLLRAAIMAFAVAAGMVVGRRWSLSGLLTAGGAGLLVWRPEQLFEPGFQLSFGIVLGLIHFAGPLRRRWFGPPADMGRSRWRGSLDVLADSFAASAVAVTIATPIVAYHFDLVTPWAVLLGLIALPPVAALLVIGYIRLLAAAVVPGLAGGLDPPLHWLAGQLISLAENAALLPGATLAVPARSAGVTALALLGCVLYLWPDHRGTLVRLRIPLLMSTALALLVPLPRAGPGLAARFTTLDVGDGSCHVLQSAGQAILIDAGSLGQLDAGPRLVLPALRALGINRLDAIVISHANLDHYGAAWGLLGELPVARIAVTTPFRNDAASNPHRAPAAFLRDIRRAGITLDIVDAGSEWTVGDIHLRWLHPSPNDHLPESNDTSAAICATVAGRTLLFTGDLEAAGLAALRERRMPYRPDVLELPHHGAWSDAAVQFVQELQPRLIVQSTGPRRLAPDRWLTVPDLPRRFITARDGAITIEIDRNSRLTARRFPVRIVHGSDPAQRVTTR